MNPTEQEFISIVMSTPGLCENGIGTEMFFKTTGVNYQGSKKQLLRGYQEFITCCTWLDKMCRPATAVSWTSPNSRTLQDLAKHPNYVSNGAMIAAIIYRHIPYTLEPASPNINVAITRNPSSVSAR